MKTSSTLLVGLTFLLLATPTSGQNLALGARAGTWGFGGEGAVDIASKLTVRAGLGSFLMDYEGEMDGVEYTVTPPSFTGTVGLDLYPTGDLFRLMGGIMFRNGDFELESGDLSQAGGVEIGNAEYTEAGKLLGSVSTSSAAPFVGVGVGRHTIGGFGVFLDLGVAFVGEPDVDLRAEGPIASAPDIQENLDLEVQAVEDDAAPYLKYWPIISFGLKIPLG